MVLKPLQMQQHASDKRAHFLMQLKLHSSLKTELARIALCAAFLQILEMIGTHANASALPCLGNV